MEVWRKQTTKRDTNRTIRSQRFYGTIKRANGKRKQIPLTNERATSKALLMRLQLAEDDKRANGITDAMEGRLLPIAEHVAAYIGFLATKGNTAIYVRQTGNRLKRLLAGCKIKTLADADTETVAKVLAAYRADGVSIKTSNYYAQTIKGFVRWCYTERKTNDDSLRSLRYLNARLDRRRVRRTFTPTEFQRLTTATRDSGKVSWGLSAEDRAMLYMVAAYTGLRAAELASLTKDSFDIQVATVTVQAAYSKHRRNDTLPLHASLVPILERWISKKGSGLLWVGDWSSNHSSHVCRMYRADLERAAIPYRDTQGRYADFHALRHTFISSLARCGVHPAMAKELARHSTITLTMDVYSHIETERLRESVNALPSLLPSGDGEGSSLPS